MLEVLKRRAQRRRIRAPRVVSCAITLGGVGSFQTVADTLAQVRAGRRFLRRQGRGGAVVVNVLQSSVGTVADLRAGGQRCRGAGLEFIRHQGLRWRRISSAPHAHTRLHGTVSVDGLIDVTETIRQRRWWRGSYPLGGVTGGRRQGRPGAVFGTPALTRISVPAVANVGTVMRLRLVTNAPGSIRRFGTTQVRRDVIVEQGT